MPQYREEVINVTLANALREYGLAADPETVTKGGLPDVLINMSGVKVILEGRFGHASTLAVDSRRRVEDGLSDISLALVYDPDLREAEDLPALEEKLQNETYSGVIFSLSAAGIDERCFQALSLRDLVEALNSVFKLYVKNEILRKNVERVQAALDGAVEDAVETGLFFESEAVVDRLKRVLGIEE